MTTEDRSPSFEVFKKRARPASTDPFVTIQQKGTISMNRAAYNAIGAPEAVELLYDRTEKIVGVRAVDPAVEHAYPVRSTGRSKTGSVLVAGTAFTKYYGIPTGVARRWPAKAANGVLMVDLKEEGTEVTSNRSRSKRRQDPERSPDSHPVQAGVDSRGEESGVET